MEMESTLRELSTNIEVITYLAQKTLDELTEMQAVIEEAMEQEIAIMSQG